MTVFPLLLSSDFSIEESYSLYSYFASGVSIEEYELFQSYTIILDKLVVNEL